MSKKIAKVKDGLSLLCILLSKTSIHTETGKKWSWHGGKCARKSDNLASHGNMFQHSIALIDPNSIQETSNFNDVCLSSSRQTWPSINLDFLQGGIMMVFIRPSLDKLSASRSQRNLVHSYCLLILKHLLRSCHSPETDGQAQYWSASAGCNPLQTLQSKQVSFPSVASMSTYFWVQLLLNLRLSAITFPFFGAESDILSHQFSETSAS